LLDNHTKIDKNHILKHNQLKFGQIFQPENDKNKKKLPEGQLSSYM